MPLVHFVLFSRWRSKCFSSGHIKSSSIGPFIPDASDLKISKATGLCLDINAVKGETAES